MNATEKERKPIGWCREERLRILDDVLVEETSTYTLVRCVAGMHCGKWILWDAVGKLVAVGTEDWVRRKLVDMHQ